MLDFETQCVDLRIITYNMEYIKRIINLGLSDSLSNSDKRGVKILNLINFFSLIIILIMAFYVNVISYSIYNIMIAFALIVMISVPLVFNYYKRIILSRLIFILFCYLIILASSIIYGDELHFQYFILIGISLPLLLFDREIGNYKWFLVLIALPIGLYQELHFIIFEPILEMNEFSIYWIRLSNDIILFLTILLMLLVFTNQNYKQYEKIEKSNLKLKQKNLELNQFAHIISHDLKVPLRRINSLTDIIVSDNQENFDEELNEKFELIKSSVKKMDQLILAVLEYSRAGSHGIDITTFNSEDLFSNLISSLNPPKNLKIILPKKSIKLTASYTQLHQVFMNLIENALKYHDKKDGFVKIGMIQSNKNLIEFNVEDDGPGIPVHFHNKLLQIFQTANLNFRKDSTGVGLAIVKKLVEQNGGKLTFNSVYGDGANFRFSWPENIKKSINLF